MSFPFEYLTTYENAVGAPRDSVKTLEGAMDVVCRYDDLSLPRVADSASSLRTLALACLKVSFLTVLTDAERADYLSSVEKVDAASARDMASLASMLPTTSLCDGSFVSELVDSSLMKGVKAPSMDHAVVICQLALRTEILLSSGGDDRLTLKMNAGRINKYFCSTLPRSYVLRRGSCTCSTTTMAQFEIAERNRIAMLSKALKSAEKKSAQACMDAAMEINDDIRYRLGKSLGIDTNDSRAHQIVMFPSGSDAELLPVYVALTRNPSKVFNFVTAAGEVGSGTPNAANMRHFSALKTMGGKQENNGCLAGYDGSSVELIEFKPRKTDGTADFREQEIVSSIESKLSSAPGSLAVLHLVLGSKTGLICPSRNFLDTMRAKFGSSLIIVADACQLRCTAAFIKSLVDDGIVCLITGSKFFSGPPFSGAVLLPASMSTEIETSIALANCPLPKGLNTYLTPYDAPSSMPQLRKFLEIPSQDEQKAWSNPGLSLRWLCGVQGIEDFYSMPPAVVDAFTSKWVNHTKALVRECSPYLEVLEVSLGSDGDIMVGKSNTIVSIIPNVPNGCGGFRRLTADECKIYHQLMGKDCSHMFNCDDEGKALLKHTMMLGQTVKLSGILSIVRIALGADMVNEALAEYKRSVDSPDHMQMAFDIAQVMEVDQLVVRKMALLCRLWFERSIKVTALTEMDKRFEGVGSPSVSAIADVSRISIALKAMSSVPKSALLYDLDALDTSMASLKSAFCRGSTKDSDFIHAFATKACPVSYILHRFVQNGMGLECASIVEVQQALRIGCPANRVVFDSPIKTREEIVLAIKKGVCMNANSWSELEKIKDVVAELGTKAVTGTIGVRVNPLIGAGAIAELSVATASSKFGIPLTSENRTLLIKTFMELDYLKCVMSHVGSQGMAVEKLVAGAECVFTLANDIDTACGSDRITMIDIGGGLSANYDSDEVKPSFALLVDAIERIVPSFFLTNKAKGRKVVTEYGKSLVTKCGVVAAKVEDAFTTLEENASTTAIVHAGADLFPRTAYAPDKFHHRVEILDNAYKKKGGATTSVNVVGPLCFSGDVLVKGMALPKPTAGDTVLVLDAGANTYSLFSRHCSRQAPPIYGVRGTTAVCIKEGETPEDVMAFWG